MLRRTATTERVAEALHVKPATVRKYARDHILPFDTTPGGHRRFDVDEAVQAVVVAMTRAGRPGAVESGEAGRPGAIESGEAGGPGVVESGEAGWEPAPDIPYVRVEPAHSVVVTALATAPIDDAPIGVYDTPEDQAGWATGLPVV